MIKTFIKILIITLLLSNTSYAKSEYFQEGVNLYNNKKFEDAKFKFEQDIIFNPKSELSYLYLAKIFNEEKKYSLEEQNLNTVILLNPKNEEAVFLLILSKIRQSDYSESEKLIKNFKKICKNLCEREKELNVKLKNLLIK